jgi:O-antigen/teichoic acid export membrane protein
MFIAVAFFLNVTANFVFGVAVSALLGPAEFGRYATVALAAITLGGAMFDWLRFSSLRFAGDSEGRKQVAASLDAGYLLMVGLLCLGAGAVALSGVRFGLTPSLLMLTPLLAIALNRCDFSGALFRARDQTRAFAALYGLRQLLAFTVVVGVAYRTREAAPTIAALAATSLIPAIALASALRTPGARLNQASRENLARFFVYAKPIVASLVIYQLIGLINRQSALDHLGADATGQLSLATDLGMRLFQAINSLPEMLLFQYALKRERENGREAAERQIGVNIVLVFALLAPLAAGYMAMAPTFETLLVPSAYRGDFARLSLELAPGFVAWCAISSMLNPVFQLAKRTWPLTIAALIALATDLALLHFGGAARSTDALARAYSISLAVGFAVSLMIALRNPAVRPKAREIAIIAVATLVMALAIRPLNGLGSPAVAALLAPIVGGGVFGSALLAFDVAGLRARALAAWRAPRDRWSPLARRHY